MTGLYSSGSHDPSMKPGSVHGTVAGEQENKPQCAILFQASAWTVSLRLPLVKAGQVTVPSVGVGEHSTEKVPGHGHRHGKGHALSVYTPRKSLCATCYS